ncbi:MAG: hypothetical protein MZV65_35970 [Chromatiales bacterium]|nr:hypothetical protein [Chromatiales bacterium]
MNLTLMSLLVFIVAALYSSAGFGGASGYLIVMNLFDVPANIMASTALLSKHLCFLHFVCKLLQSGAFPFRTAHSFSYHIHPCRLPGRTNSTIQRDLFDLARTLC